MPLARPFEAARLASSLLVAFTLSVPASAAVPSAARDGHHPVFVTSIAGHVDVSMADMDADPRAGDEVLLPARIVTGSDGTIGLEQSRTTISIAPDSEIEIPKAAYDGQLIARLVQWRGNVFYDVEKREVERLTVETPYLVAVVKGTQFNVSVLDGTTTISLFEGRLEIRDPDGANIVDLEAGEVAIRSRDDTTIRVIDMNVAELPAIDRNGGLVAARADENAADGSDASSDDRADGLPLSGSPLRLDAAASSGDLALRRDETLRADVGLADPGMLATVDALGTEQALGAGGLDAGADLGPVGVDLAASSSVSFDSASLSADLGATADLGNGAIGADLGAGLDLGGATADVDLGAGLDLGDATADVDLGAGLDLGAGTADLGLGVDASAGDLGLDAAADLGVTGGLADASLDAGLGADVGAGDLGVGADLDTSLDVGDGMLAGGLDAGVDVGDTGLDAGLDAGVDIPAGEVTAGLEVDGLVDAGVGAGLDVGGGDLGLEADVSLPGGLDASLDVDLGGDDGGLLGDAGLLGGDGGLLGGDGGLLGGGDGGLLGGGDDSDEGGGGLLGGLL